MRLRIEQRPEPSAQMRIAAPVIATALTFLAGSVLFAALGYDPLITLHAFFVAPLNSINGLSEWLLKASPLILIACGLAVGFRANIWNIGAEGQLIIGAIAACGVGLFYPNPESPLLLPLMFLAGAGAGMVWAAIPAFLRARMNTNEILVTLMLTYIATLLLSFLVHGPWRDPAGFNYPQTALLPPAAMFEPFDYAYRLNPSVFITAVAVVLMWLFADRSFLGYKMSVSGAAPLAARYAGFREFLRSLDRIACRRRGGRNCRHGRSRRSSRAIVAADFARLWLCRNHRCVHRTPERIRHRPRGAFDVASLPRRRNRSDDARPSGSAHPHLPRGSSVLPARRRFLHLLPPSPHSGARVMDLFIAIFTGTIIAATPLIFASLGELVVEKSGVLNLGLEGMMLMGAAFAFWAVISGLPMPVAIAAGALAGAATSLLFGVLALTFLTNQYAAGLALAIFGSGVSAFLGRGFGSTPIDALKRIHIPLLSDIPVVGPLFFRFDPMVYLAIAIFGLITWFLYRTKGGLILRTIGESPETSHAIGYPVIRIRYMAVLFGGLMAGLAGAYLSVAYTPLWVENMTAGKGWISLALVVFATWRPLRVLIGAWLFGGMTILQLQGQALGIAVPSELLSALPYLATIIVLVIISQNRQMLALHFPASLAKPFRAAS